jgi:hypothetical protein
MERGWGERGAGSERGEGGAGRARRGKGGWGERWKGDGVSDGRCNDMNI